MNTKLKELYSTYWQSYLDNVRDDFSSPAAFPFLIVPEDSYLQARERIMICGQETQGWGNELDGQQDPVTVSQVQDIYRGFVWPGGYNSPYWNFINKIKCSFLEKGFVINNIVKVGRRFGPGCDDRINDKALKFFPVSREELTILRPDKIVFLTGPDYDWRIQKVLGPYSKKKAYDGMNCLDILTFNDSSLPKAIRCYHPGYMKRKKITETYLKMIIDFCRQ